MNVVMDINIDRIICHNVTLRLCCITTITHMQFIMKLFIVAVIIDVMFCILSLLFFFLIWICIIVILFLKKLSAFLT